MLTSLTLSRVDDSLLFGVHHVSIVDSVPGSTPGDTFLPFLGRDFLREPFKVSPAVHRGKPLGRALNDY